MIDEGKKFELSDYTSCRRKPVTVTIPPIENQIAHVLEHERSGDGSRTRRGSPNGARGNFQKSADISDLSISDTTVTILLLSSRHCPSTNAHNGTYGATSPARTENTIVCNFIYLFFTLLSPRSVE